MTTYTMKVREKEIAVRVLRYTGSQISFEVAGEEHTVDVELLHRPRITAAAHQPPPPRQVASQPSPRVNAGATGAVRAPMPGIVAKILVKEGQEVSAGEPVIVVEAMKMENSIAAPRAGKVQKIAVSAGQEVKNGEELLMIA